MTIASIIALAKSCVHLRAIDIGWCMRLTDDGLVAFASYCSNMRTVNVLDGADICNLRRISLHGCEFISDIGISAVACNFRLLNSIDISVCRYVTDVGLSAIADNCPELHTINLSDLVRFDSDIPITDIGVSAIADTPTSVLCRQLER